MSSVEDMEETKFMQIDNAVAFKRLICPICKIDKEHCINSLYTIRKKCKAFKKTKRIAN